MSRERSRSSSNAQPGELGAEGDRLGVDAVGPSGHDRVAVLDGPADHGGLRAIDAVEDELSGRPHLERGGSVEHVRRREPVVKPASGGAEPLGHGVDERRQVVLRPLLDLGDPLRRRRQARARASAAASAGTAPTSAHASQGGQLHLEPARKLALLRPDVLHGRSGVAGDHTGKSSERAGYSSAVGRPGVPG